MCSSKKTRKKLPVENARASTPNLKVHSESHEYPVKDESTFAWPTGRGEKLETAISGGGPSSAGKETEIYN